MPNLPVKILQLYCERFSEVPLAVTDSAGMLKYANRAFQKQLNLEIIPPGVSIHDYLNIRLNISEPIYEDETSGIKADLVTASFNKQGEISKLRGHLFFDGTDYVIIFDIFKQHDVEILEQVTKMNLEMSSMTRDYSKQYRKMNKEAQHQKHLAGQDQLTGLPNRRHFEEEVLKSIKGEKPKTQSFGVILLDIDNFKQVNDTYGHDAGDEVLRMLSKKIKDQIRLHDTPARYGGEEFIILADCDTVDQLRAFAEKLRSTVESMYIPAISSSITASFGITMYQDGDDLGSLIKRSDELLYRAKHNGKNRVES